jgi:hypothetical protein
LVTTGSSLQCWTIGRLNRSSRLDRKFILTISLAHRKYCEPLSVFRDEDARCESRAGVRRGALVICNVISIFKIDSVGTTMAGVPARACQIGGPGRFCDSISWSRIASAEPFPALSWKPSDWSSRCWKLSNMAMTSLWSSANGPAFRPSGIERDASRSCQFRSDSSKPPTPCARCRAFGHGNHRVPS